jgi:two-component system response regulator DesR
MRILVADRNVAVRSAVTVYLQNAMDLDTVHEARDDEELLAQAEAFRPDILLLDWNLPGDARAQLLTSLRAFDPPPNVIALGCRPEQKPDALAEGADCFFYKGDPPRRLLATVRFVEADRAAG